MRRFALVLIASLVSSPSAAAQTRTRPAKPTARPAPAKPAALYKTALTLDEMKGKQAVVETARGTFVIQLLPEAAPNHVGYFIAEARKGTYDRTAFHRAVPMGIVQGGDPLSKDPAKRAVYGTGGLGMLAAETSGEPMARGAVAAVLQPGNANSAGTQFFVAVSDQKALTGQFTVFGRVVEGLEVVQDISMAPIDDDGRLRDRIEITRVSIRDAAPAEPAPFSTEAADELASYRAVIETPKGAIRLAFDPAKAPGHVRNFLRLAATGVYDGTTFHRVVRGFVIQGGMVSTRAAPLTQKQQEHVTTLAPEFNDTPHLPGILSMARTADPASASTSFFICTGPAPSLDGQYSVFGRVIDGMDVVRAIEAEPVAGEDPVSPVVITRVRIERLP